MTEKFDIYGYYADITNYCYKLLSSTICQSYNIEMGSFEGSTLYMTTRDLNKVKPVMHDAVLTEESDKYQEYCIKQESMMLCIHSLTPTS